MKHFKKGERVKLTEHGIDQGFGIKTSLRRKPFSDFGYIVRDQKDAFVLVQRTGYKTAQRWHEDFWEKEK